MAIVNNVKTGMREVGPHTACCLLGLWSEGQIVLSLEEFRHLVKVVANFLEELEDIRANSYLSRR